jgi:hypothetical protein
MLTSTSIIDTPRLRPGIHARLARIGTGRWRVLDESGVIIGHIDARPERQGIRYLARRYHPASRAFLERGAFWSVEDAVDCLLR